MMDPKIVKKAKEKKTPKIEIFFNTGKNVYPTKKGGMEGDNRIFGQFPKFCKKNQKYQFLENRLFRAKLF